MRLHPTKLLAAYSAVLTLGLIGVGAMAAAPRRASFDEIDVQRINVREPDGKLRLVISDHARWPGAIVRGKEVPHPRDGGGMLFYNDEESEDGGLMVSGRRAADGKPDAGGSLTFDQYEQDQVVQLVQNEEGGRRYAGVRVFDRPDAPLDIAAGVALRRDPAALKRAVEAGVFGVPRAFFGKDEDRASRLVLRDGKGRPRLQLSVAEDGSAEVAFLGEDGRVTKRLAP